jgi:RNA polymerase sigma-70 factor, ECF subfamily
VWRQADRFECRSSVPTWLMSIARHKALSARRRRTDAELDENIEATLADPANDPEAVLQEKDRDELLRRALTRLSREHREVIDLVYYHEKSVDEVAHILDVPAATVKTRMFYARKKLAELVQLGSLPNYGYSSAMKGADFVWDKRPHVSACRGHQSPCARAHE